MVKHGQTCRGGCEARPCAWLRTAALVALLAGGVLSAPAQAAIVLSGSNCGTGTLASTGTDTSQLIVGCAAPGSLTVDSTGALTTANASYASGSISLVSGYANSGTASILVNGNGAAGSATLNAAHAVEIGFPAGATGGNGSLTVQNGGLMQITTAGYELTIANSNSTGSVVVDGSTSKLVSGSDIYVAGFTGGTASLTVQNGATVQTGSGGADNGSLIAGTGGTTQATVTVTGAGSTLSTNGFILGDGFDSGSNVSVTISAGGTASVAAPGGAGSGIGIGASGNATVLVTGTNSKLTVAPITAGFNAGKEIVIGGYGNGSLIVDQAATVAAAGANVVVSGGVFGTQTSAPGTLTVKNGASLTASSVTVNQNGTLNGNGTVNADVTLNGGVIAPGNSPGTITVNGDLNAIAGIFNLEIASDTLADHLNVSGNVDIGPDAIFNLIFEYQPAVGKIFSLEDFFSLTGGGAFNFDPAFDLDSQVTVTGLSAGGSVLITGDGQRLAFSSPVGAPEPVSISILAAGLGGIGMFRLRARRAKG